MASICKIKDKDTLQLLLSPVDEVIKIKPETKDALKKAGMSKVIQVLLQLPTSFRNRGFSENLEEGKIVTLKFFVQSKSKFRNSYSVKGTAQTLEGLTQQSQDITTSKFTLNFFSWPYFWADLKKGSEVYVSGLVQRRGKTLCMNHPDYVEKVQGKIPKIEPVYSSTGLNNVTFMRIVQRLLSEIAKKIDSVEDWQDCEVSFLDALRILHEEAEEGKDEAKVKEARLRILRDEMLAIRFLWEEVKLPSHGLQITFKELNFSLPFQLTESQISALREIKNDVAKGEFMYRLLQGDVGSGKTIVAFLSMIQFAMNSYSACLMAPTQVLARQHYEKLKELLKDTGIMCQYVTSTSKMEEADSLFGQCQLFVGTHALFQRHVEFRNLGLIIIDEQHRFGVAQRANLFKKGYKCHMLMMSATPIPRTLFLSKYCGLKTSQLDKIKGRQKVETTHHSQGRIRDVWKKLNGMLDKTQCYWICPLISDYEASAEERFKEMSEYFSDWKLGILHGAMKSAEKEKTLMDFLSGKIRLLVATSVVEVGVDAPSANIMVIEHAERFGLVALHQLRGRVGRGQDKGYCLLLYGDSVSDSAKERLNLIKNTHDGLALAKADLKMRGKGDILGKVQSGDKVFRFGELDEAEQQQVNYNVSEDARSFLSRAFSLALEIGNG